jgi:hypothetical protein
MKYGNLASKLLVLLIGLALAATIAAWALHPSKRPPTPKVVVGTKDEVYYYHAATKEDAQTLGQALVRIGFLNDRGTTVLLSKGSAGTVVLFVLNDGAWDRAATVYTFEEIGRRIAPAIGGFPIEVRLIDSARALHRQLSVGRAAIGAKDEVYYFGDATGADAAALGHALQAAGFFADRGASVVLSRSVLSKSVLSKSALAEGAGTGISFVLDEGAWNLPGTATGFERLVRGMAASVGGLPIEIRLLNPRMEPEKQWTVR